MLRSVISNYNATNRKNNFIVKYDRSRLMLDFDKDRDGEIGLGDFIAIGSKKNA